MLTQHLFYKISSTSQMSQTQQILLLFFILQCKQRFRYFSSKSFHHRNIPIKLMLVEDTLKNYLIQFIYRHKNSQHYSNIENYNSCHWVSSKSFLSSSNNYIMTSFTTTLHKLSFQIFRIEGNVQT